MAMGKEVPVTYNGILVGVAERGDDTEEGVIVNVRLNQDSLIPLFVDHTMDSISISDDNLGPDEIDPNRLCNSCDLIYGHDGDCGPIYTQGL